MATSEKTITKITLNRNCTIRTIYGGYARLLEDDGALGVCKFVPKGTRFTIISFNLYTKTVLAVHQESKETYSLEYDYILNNCVNEGPTSNTVLDGVSIVGVTIPATSRTDLIPIVLGLSILANILLLLSFVL